MCTTVLNTCGNLRYAVFLIIYYVFNTACLSFPFNASVCVCVLKCVIKRERLSRPHCHTNIEEGTNFFRDSFGKFLHFIRKYHFISRFLKHSQLFFSFGCEGALERNIFPKRESMLPKCPNVFTDLIN